jgi:hypothetical protein
VVCRLAAAAGWVLVQPLTWSEDMQANRRLLGSSGFRYVIRVEKRGTLYWRGFIQPKVGFNTKHIWLPESTLGAFTPEGAERVARLVDDKLEELGRGAHKTFIIEAGEEVARLRIR